MNSRQDDLIDLLGHLLRAFGAHSFDTEGVRHEGARVAFERWASHLLVGGPHPQTGQREERRDFGGARRAFVNHRKAEVDHVRRMGEVLRHMATGLRDVFAKDRKADRVVAEQLVKLEEAAQSGDLAALRVHVIDAVSVVRESIERRHHRHRSTLKTMGRQLRDLKTALLEAKKKAEIDGLTQLYNRASFNEHLANAIDFSALAHEPLSLLLIDVDHFKKLNDGYGHPFGDHTLRLISDAVVRVASRRTDFVARYGGEEIAVVLGDTPAPGAIKVASRVCEAIRSLELKNESGRVVAVTVSVGAATLEDGEDASSLLSRADRALYAAKHSGRDRYVTAA